MKQIMKYECNEANIIRVQWSKYYTSAMKQRLCCNGCTYNINYKCNEATVVLQWLIIHHFFGFVESMLVLAVSLADVNLVTLEVKVFHIFLWNSFDNTFFVEESCCNSFCVLAQNQSWPIKLSCNFEDYNPLCWRGSSHWQVQVFISTKKGLCRPVLLLQVLFHFSCTGKWLVTFCIWTIVALKNVTVTVGIC